MKKYAGVHKLQLFHWIGRHIEGEHEASKLTSSQRGKYVDALRSSLQNGLWMRRPPRSELLVPPAETHPITCFTEWDLARSPAHCSRYGRLGFGFSKRFVLSRGGHPVLYTSRNSKVVRSARAIVRALQQSDAKAASDFAYLSHFMKPVNHVASRAPAMIANDRANVRQREAAAGEHDITDAEPSPYARTWGRKPLAYLEEREWRIVATDDDQHDFKIPSNRRTHDGAGPDLLLTYVAGTELFTVAVPDNETLHLAMHDDVIRGLIHQPGRPHVTMLSLEDIGTF